jgi:hypothetical protein
MRRSLAYIIVLAIFLLAERGTVLGMFGLSGGPKAMTAGTCHERNGLPDSNCTPGSADPRVKQDNIMSTICISGYTKTVRPSTSYTAPLKILSIEEYGYADKNVSDYEYDHMVPLEIGGNATDTRNLWAEPEYGPYSFHDKDGFENYLHRMVCGGKMNLSEAQREIATDWVYYWEDAGEPKG